MIKCENHPIIIPQSRRNHAEIMPKFRNYDQIKIKPCQNHVKIITKTQPNLPTLWSGVAEHVDGGRFPLAPSALGALPGQVPKSRPVWLKLTRTLTRSAYTSKPCHGEPSELSMNLGCFERCA